jgi:hypothetical protein
MQVADHPSCPLRDDEDRVVPAVATSDAVHYRVRGIDLLYGGLDRHGVNESGVLRWHCLPPNLGDRAGVLRRSVANDDL